MKFTFEGSAAEFNAATMEEVLLRLVQTRGRRNAVICLLCLALLAVGIWSFFMGSSKRCAVFGVLALLLFLYLRRSSAVAAGRAQQTILRLLEAENAQSEEEHERVFTYTFEGSVCTMSSNGKVLGTWAWTSLDRVGEADGVIALWRVDSEAHQSVLPIPKKCLKDGTLDEFRDYLNGWLDGKKRVTYYKIPAYLKELLN